MIMMRIGLLLQLQILLLSKCSTSAFAPDAWFNDRRLQRRRPNHADNYPRNLFGSTFVLVPSSPIISLKNQPNNNNNNDDDSTVNEYRNDITRFLSRFLPSSDPKATLSQEDPITPVIDHPKIPNLPLETLAALLDAELLEKEWFVTGKVNASYFSDDFEFQDPDVKVKGVQDYARGVVRLFDQATSRAEIISSVVNTTQPNTITVTWRLSGKVNVGPGLVIKPYICYTDFTVDESTGLIRFQQDRFDIPGWDILLSALFPFLIGIVTSPPAPPVPPRQPQPLLLEK